MQNLNKIFKSGLLALGTTALITSLSVTHVSAQEPAAQATAPATADLLDPSASLDQQTALQSTADTPVAAPAAAAQPSLTLEDIAAKTKSAAQQVLNAPKEQVAPLAASKTDSNTPALDQLGMSLDAPSSSAQLNAPPGLDLPPGSDLQDVEVEKTEEQKAAELRKEAFDAASQGLMPMKQQEIRKLLEMYDETQQAVQAPIYPNPKPESTFQTISLDPGTPPVELKTAVGHVTTLSIVDATGQPWPIQDISWAGNFEVLQPEPSSNMLRITPMADFAFGNVSMRLIGLNPPVILTLRTERKSVQVRADVQIPEIGPNGVTPPIQRQITTTAGDNKLATILEGVPPSSANKLRIDGIDGRTTAYDIGGTTYVRTPYTLLSPAWDASVRSADGTNVYAMKFTPVLLLSDKGKMVRAQLTKAVESDGQ